MHRGQLVEQGPTRDVLTNPQQEYTKRLVGSSPIADPVAQRKRHKK